MTTVNITDTYKTVVVTDGDGTTTNVTAASPSAVVNTIGLGPQGPGGTLAAYATIIDTTDQPLASTTTAQPLTLNTVLASRAVTISNNSRINFALAGTYKVLASLQVTNSSNNVSELQVFFKKNGTIIPDSNTHVDIQARKSVNAPFHACVTIEYQLNVTDNDYVEIYWSSDTSGVVIDTIPANAIHPQAPSAIINVAQVMYYQTSLPNGVNNGDTLIWNAATNQWQPSNLLTLLEQRVTALESV